ncbi:hypothetical protein [Streptomyces mirabilis]|uniref:hypothetical protein n=1 Tax=Streptomyces mirabilis TaxID=68239 RepID=UPI00167E7D32|nr:hypothetical protein [Streptomyces mirabilis]
MHRGAAFAALAGVVSCTPGVGTVSGTRAAALLTGRERVPGRPHGVGVLSGGGEAELR